MASTNPYEEMLASIDDWLKHQDKLANLEHQSWLRVQDIPDDLAEAIEDEKKAIAQLDAKIVSEADKVIDSPFGLLEGRLSSACRDYLQDARKDIADGNIVDDCGDCGSAYASLKLGKPCARNDRGALYLMLAKALSDQGCHDEANRLTANGLAQLPSDDHELRAAAYLIHGSNRPTYFEARHAYTEVLRQLTILMERANEESRRKEAKRLQALKASVEKRLSGLREDAALWGGPKNGGTENGSADYASLPPTPKGPSPASPGDLTSEKLSEPPLETPSKTVPFRPRRIPVFGEIAAGREIINPDDIVDYIQQTGELEFKLGGRLLEARPVGKSRITFSREYDYIAVRVSGDSMDRADIFPGDYVVVRRTKAPAPGDIVAVVIRDEDDNRATLKRISIEPNKVTLKPESSNRGHDPRFLPREAFAGDNPPVAIVGIAIAVLKAPPSKTP